MQAPRTGAHRPARPRRGPRAGRPGEGERPRRKPTAVRGRAHCS